MSMALGLAGDFFFLNLCIDSCYDRMHQSVNENRLVIEMYSQARLTSRVNRTKVNMYVRV